jgi:hypothetical protein
MLTDLVDNRYTDKNTTHSYLPLYDELLKSRKETARAVLEVGVCWGGGGSIALWHRYFTNAVVHGLDILSDYPELLQNRGDWPRVQLQLGVNAYTVDVASKVAAISGKLDMALDDGPHTLESMLSFIALYLPLIADDGILIIEDVQDYAWFESLKAAVPADMQSAIQTYDRREIKQRYDDLVFVVDKSLLR